MTDMEQVRDQLASIGQDHLLRMYHMLTPGQQGSLLNQIKAIDLDQVPIWVQQYVTADGGAHVPDRVEPPTWYPRDPNEAGRSYDADHFRAAGEAAIRAGKIAVFCVAGGQGSRLGWDAPKGTFPATPIHKKPLFQVFAEQILAAQMRYGTVIPWYIMTSPLNHQATVTFFDEHQYFGLDRGTVTFFRQGVMPSFDLETGRMLLASSCELAVNPDGHGGSLRALWVSGSIDDMKQRGIEHISYIQVDNPLARAVDPLFIGLHLTAPDSSAEMSSKMVRKTGPFEKLGNFCHVDGKTTIIEYSDLPAELAEQRDDQGHLRFAAGSIAIHLIGIGFIEQLNAAASGFGLPFHRAVKAVPYYDLQTQQLIEPSEPNAVKLEMFVFDALPLCRSSIVLETDRGEEFAPIKNPSGVDSAESARALQLERAANWLEQAGVKVERDDATGQPLAAIEISPLTALEAADLKQTTLPTSISAGDTVEL
ncbi:MAG: UDPGP type 1 family protein [Planctomycetes bacterium]|nr:UDPGP type 1 family protein [Planctomycetota bacterium]